MHICILYDLNSCVYAAFFKSRLTIALTPMALRIVKEKANSCACV